MSVPAIKPAHKAIQKYHETLAEFLAGKVAHEGATRFAFQTLVHETCRSHGWNLIPEERTKVGGKTVIPDGTLRDMYNLHRGFWEAKDTSDDLSVEIQKKTKLGYPLTNTIFEDTAKAVLFQGKKAVYEADLTDKQQVADLLNQFYEYHEPEHEDFEQAVDEFQERVPDLAKGLADMLV